MITVRSLHIYPVKSCRGIELETAEVGPTGFCYDRQWMVVDARVNPSFPLAFSNGLEVTLGTTVGVTALPAAFLYGQNINAVVRGTVGLVDRGITLVTEITYQ